MPQLSRTHVRAWLAAVVAAVVAGLLGYVALGGWSFGDALYMTVITLTTVGFREVRELDGVTRVWTMVVAIAGVGLIFGSVGIVAEYVVSEVTSGRREARRMAKAVEGLRDHWILCGYGRVGSTVARELEHGGERVVVIDSTGESLARAQRDGHLVVEGDAADNVTLVTAGVDRARGLVAAVDTDAHNVYVILSARALNPRLFVVARANTHDAEVRLTHAGADRVVSPYGMAGRRLAELAMRPRVVDFIDAALSHGELAFSMEEVTVAAGGRLEGRSVGALRDEGVFVLAVVRGEREYEANPPADRHLAAGETLIVSGPAAQLETLRRPA